MSPKVIAERLDCSSSYLAKTANLLVKARVLRSVRGVNGGVLLARRPERISLLEIIEACQGLLTADFCENISAGPDACAFHIAMQELHERTLATLSSWTLDRILENPICPKGTIERQQCRMYFEGCDCLTPHDSPGERRRAVKDRGLDI